jgi:hypothetical protein
MYLLLAAYYSAKDNFLMNREKNNEVDFITQSKKQYHYFGLGLTLMGVTIITYSLDKDSVC